MDGKRAAPGEPDPRETGADGEVAPEADPTAGQTERYGPLELRRLRKDDGRALIVFSRTTTDATQ